MMKQRKSVLVLATFMAFSFAQAEDGLPTDELTAKAAQGDIATQFSLAFR